jgi:hypothetical protein
MVLKDSAVTDFQFFLHLRIPYAKRKCLKFCRVLRLGNRKNSAKFCDFLWTHMGIAHSLKKKKNSWGHINVFKSAYSEPGKWIPNRHGVLGRERNSLGNLAQTCDWTGRGSYLCKA